MNCLKIYFLLLKLVLIKVLLIIFLVSSASQANEIVSEYTVSTSGIKIGKFNWFLNINNDHYETKIYLKNSGFFSPLYKFKGEYISKGYVLDKFYKTKYYKQSWETNKKTKIVEMKFNEQSISLIQEPKEKEHARININSFFHYCDPIVSFINILNKNDFVKTIDGRRVYIMRKKLTNNSKKIVLEIHGYQNIWADHKRNDLEKIELILDDNSFLPRRVSIFFKDRIFKLEKN